MTSEIVSETSEYSVAIVGIGIHVPGASTPQQFWENLENGIESVTDVSESELISSGVPEIEIQDPRYVARGAFLESIAEFDPEFFGLSPKEAAIMDPQHRHFLEVCWEALESAGHPPGLFDGSIGVFGGCGMGKYMFQNVMRNRELMESVGYFLLRHTGNDKDFLTTRVSYSLNLNGPSVGIQTACSTSLVAVHLATQSLLGGECDLALAGGVTIEIPNKVGYLYVENEILSPDGHCRAFDHRSKGTIFGSGAGAVALRRLNDAIEDGDHIYAVIRGTAVNNDGSVKVGYLAPSVDGQAAAIAEALEVAEVSADTIGYVEAHGTGTPVGDPIEVQALSQAFRGTTSNREFCGIGSVKTNIGHTDTAAGVISLIKAALAIEHAKLPPTLNWEAPNPEIDFTNTPFYVNHTLKDWQSAGTPRRAGVNSLGVGGTNAHVILEQAPEKTTELSLDSRPETPKWLGFSAYSIESLDGYGDKLAAHLRANPDLSLEDVSYSLGRSRHEFKYRRTLACRSIEEASEILESKNPFRLFTHTKTLAPPSVVFLFPGGGAQYISMGADLYDTEEVYRRELDRCLKILIQSHKLDLNPFLFPVDASSEALAREFERPAIQLPAILAVEYALSRLWMSKGVQPAALIGHSMGENTAACLSGVMTLEDVLGLIVLRGRLFETIPDGGMLSILASTETIQPLLSGTLVLAVRNAPELNVVSGPANEIAAFSELLQSQDIDATRIPINVAAHSPMLAPMLEEFGAYLKSIVLSAPQIPFVSNRTGEWITAEQATSPDYWVEHLRHTVNFSDGIYSILEKFPDCVMVESGPGTTLSSLSRMQSNFSERSHTVASLRHRDQEVADDTFLHTAIGRLWACGYQQESPGPDSPGQMICLPTYSFQHREYWIDASRESFLGSAPLLKRQPSIGDWFYQPVWEPRIVSTKKQRGLFTWLVFADDLGLSGEVAESLSSMGHRIVTVRLSGHNVRVNETEYLLDSDRGEEGYQVLALGLLEDGIRIDRILHMWMVTGREETRTGLNRFAHNLERSFYSLYFLFRSLGERDALNGTHLYAISNGTRRVNNEALPNPEKATHDGMCMVAPREFSNFTCSSIDIDLQEQPKTKFGLPSKTKTGSDIQEFKDLILQELCIPIVNGRFAYRAKQKFELQYEHVEDGNTTSSEKSRSISVSPGGKYLITGGLGGLALSIAESLALTPGVTLLLVSRSGLIPREKWDQWLSENDQEDRVSKIILQVKRLEALGARVETASVDITDHEALESYVVKTERDSGVISGVIHAAGLIQDDLLMLKGMDQVEAVFAPKIYGTMVLDMVFKQRQIDFMILFSSSSTVTAPAGQVDYVAANSYLNAYAESRTGMSDRSVVALSWGVWNEVGIAAESTGSYSVDTVSTDHPLLSKLRKKNDTDVYEFVPLSPQTHWILDQHRLGDGRALVPGTLSLDLAYFVARGKGWEGATLINEIRYLSPLAVDDHDYCQVRIKFTNQIDCDIFALQSMRQGIDGVTGWMTHVEGTISRNDSAPPTNFDLEVIKDRCQSDYRVSDLSKLKTSQEAHLKFGERWSVLVEQGFGKDESYAKLELNAKFIEEDSHYQLHPGLLDIATGHAMRLISGYNDDQSTLWVPVGYSNVRIYGPLSSTIFSVIRNYKSNSIEDVQAEFSIIISDENARVLVEIEKFTIQKAPAGDLLATLNRIPPESLEAVGVRTMAAPPSDMMTPAEKLLRFAVSQGIRPIEGMLVFRKMLDNVQGSQVIISSLDLQSLLEQSEATELQENDSDVAFERPQLAGDFVEPEPGNETRLAEIWQELLGINAIGRTDSFFDLGGHSLIAVRLFAKIKSEWGTSLPISSLLESPTIEQLGEQLPQLESNDTKESSVTLKSTDKIPEKQKWTSVVPLKKTGSRTPFFCVAGKGGNPLKLRHLAKRLDENQPFYGIQHRGVDGVEPVHELIEDMAAGCIRDIKLVQSEGPYLLGGFSGGGLVAFEMTRQLTAAGEQVHLLALFDTPSPNRLSMGKKERTALHIQQLKIHGIAYIAEKLKGRIKRKKSKNENLTLAPQDSYNVEIPPHVAVGQAWSRMEARYSADPFDGSAVLFRPYIMSQENIDVFLNNDQFNGWNKFMLKGIEVIELPGGHSTMFEEPHVRILEHRLSNVIQRIANIHD